MDHRTRFGVSIILVVALFSGLLLQPEKASADPAPPKPPSVAPPTEPFEVLDAVEQLPAGAILATALEPEATIMSQNFEGTWPASGWQLLDSSSSDGGEFLWGKRNCQPRAGSYAGWSVGGGAQGSTLSCSANYPNNAYTWAIYGPFNLSNATSATLSYHLRGTTEAGTNCPYDYLFVGSSTDGAQFSGSRTCGALTSGLDGNGYYWRTLDLRSRLGQSQVWVAFAFVSDSSNAYSGFHIDDVALNVVTVCPDYTDPISVGVEDLTAVANKWGTRSGGAGWDSRYDIDQDNDVDMVDIMLTSGMWGLNCRTTPPDPLFHTALSLDGVNDYASAPDSASLDLGTNYQHFTIEAFIYVPNTTMTGAKLLVYKSNAYYLAINFRTTDQDVIYVTLYNNAGVTIQLLGFRNLNVGWHHIAAVYVNDYTPSEDMALLYLDGNQIASGGGFQFSPGLANSASPLLVGGNSASSAQFSRWMEELRFSSTVRYSAATYTVPTAPFTRDGSTRALWHFDDTVGSTIFQDSSVNGNTLTGYNGAQTGNP